MDLTTIAKINTSIDSMTVVTPLNFVKISEFYHDKMLTISSFTSEILDSTSKPIISEIDGIKIRGSIVMLFGVEHLAITYSSKMLKHLYLNGLNKHFLLAFQYAKRYLHFDCDYSTYLINSKVYDCDFKFDFYQNDKHFSEFLYEHKNFANCKLFSYKGKNYLHSKNFIGLQFVNRKDASIGKPFVKLYSKEFEFDERSIEFKTKYLPLVSLSDLRRCEVTIKNAKHFSKFDLTSKLIDVLSITENKMINIILQSYLSHVGTPVKNKPVFSSKNPITLSDWIFFCALNDLINEGHSLSSLLNEYFNSFPNISPASKTRKIKLLKQRFEVFLNIQSKFDLSRYRMTPKDVFTLKK